jgi:thioredoxin 1
LQHQFFASNARKSPDMSKDFEQEVLEAAGRVVVDFYPPWCGPYKMLTPVLEAMSEQFGGKVQFVKLNVDEAPELAADHEITGVPTLILFWGGKAVDQVVGFPVPRILKARLENAANEPVLASSPERTHSL